MIFFLGSVLCQNSYSLLGQTRANITFLPYTPEQRLQIAQSVENLFDFYVHIDQKLAMYAKEFDGEYDPRVRAKQLSALALNGSDADFHFRNVELFASLRDAHLSYNLPPPHSCYAATLAIAFGITEGSNVVVSRFSSRKEILDLAQPSELSKIQIGDQLVAVDGQSFQDYYQASKFQLYGSGDAGSFRAAVRGLSQRTGTIFRMPKQDTITFTLARDQQVFSVTLPWVASAINSCLDNLKSVQTTFQPLALGNPWVESFAKFWEPNQAAFTLQTTTEAKISYGIYTPLNLGIIQLTSFSVADEIQSYEIFHGLLTNELKDTDAIVVDLRDNGGGLSNFAARLPTLFFKDPKGIRVKAKIDRFNDEMLSNKLAVSHLWGEQYAKSDRSQKFSPFFQPMNDSVANIYGQAWFKPLAVLTNGNCYSACDFFAATIQDNEAGLIIGEDASTGGAGALVVDTQGLLSFALPKDFPRFPFESIFGSRAQNMRTPWLQAFRNGKYKDQVIEDFGVKSDYIFQPSLDDIKNKNSVSQWERISKVLPKSNNQLIVDPQLSADVAQDDKLLISVKSSTSVGVNLILDQTVLDTRKIENGTAQLEFDPSNLDLGYHRVKIQAVTTTETLETYRIIRVLPTRPWMTFSPMDLKSKEIVYNRFSLPELGWNNLTISGVYNGDKLNTTASWFFENTATVKLRVEGSLDSLAGAEFWNWYVKDQTGSHLLLSKTGKAQVNETLVFSPVGRFEIQTTMGNVLNPTVKIDTVSIEQ
ncbi:hypothetical protein EDD86DRAFT_249693 [Gorgonomyces haynaldii]|nr:hypothetical protein EDD86DRAFT_249693 [Gorgonomyces haynaldii]